METSSAKNLLLTGPPGCGKTTVVCRVIERLHGRRLAGFYTREIRRHGHREGFEAVDLQGHTAVLAHVGLQSPRRVGRYGVELSEFESLLRAELKRPFDEVDLFVIDEIGKMECYSRVFLEAANRVLDGPVAVLATVAGKGGSLIAQVKQRADIELFHVSAKNRDELPAELAARLIAVTS